MDTRPNLQTKQSYEGTEVDDKNGWPTPLTDPSSPLKIAVTNGQSGSQRDFKAMSTSNNGKGSCPEGNDPARGVTAEQGGHGNKFKTSQQNAGEHHTPEA